MPQHYLTDEQRIGRAVRNSHRDWSETHRRPMMITVIQLVKILGIPEARAEVWQPHLDSAMDKFEINTPLRASHFIAQIGHESGRLVFVKEVWADSPSQQSYEGAVRLGNTEEGDGERFMGRGPMQITGRKNYQFLSGALGVDFIAQPQLLERVDYGAMSAGWFWMIGAGMNLGHLAIQALQQYGMGAGVNLNDIADHDDIETITYCVNGGQNGIDDRQAIYRKARDVLGVTT
jgi:putative chitinase